MNGGFPVGRVAGVRIRVDWSLLIIFWLIVLSLATGIFPSSVPGQAHWVYWLLGIIAVVLFYGSLLAHELAHAVVASRKGVQVEGITLWLLGGVAQLHGEVRAPKDELAVTGVGPLVTVACSLIFFAVGLVLRALGSGDVVVVVPLWVAVINIFLAAFNLIPAFPLDGGRILHALLWRRSGDRARATISAARAGRAFGVFLIAVGVLEFFALATLGGLWFVFLGWFIVTAGRAEEAQTKLGSALTGVRVRDVMSKEPVTAPNWVTVDAFLHDYVLARRLSCFPVHDLEGRLTGVVSVRRLGDVPRGERATVRIGDVATPIDRVAKASPDELVVDVMARLHRGDDGRVLVFDAGSLVGIMSTSDVSRAVELAGMGVR
ncbi:MAG TPA: site-2 protease family protein [Candidatus Sulfotelmatobacter sp.]|nr:site-2 protease family protein [Candidatus Sulfotelmatobacter sp.]